MINLIGEVLIFLGSIFVFLAVVGFMKMPDFYMKLQAASKASAFGAGLILLGTAMIFANLNIVITNFFLFIFLLITTPIATHAMAYAYTKKNETS
ncbi:monovalent cation/H(+) antiporter subunit G [Halobacteriovorax sp. XZX-3]|uniref:monovalent cation/H(+) antiporter subunit G n=1 Tax=unclassified Halobacteriovorax TaxID=2639665 RepID=UPI000CD0FFA7|nr:monovalent cation/H(+) antiporter subunit G [Halobacteriovorax sp. DA5]POB13582.1 cation:proton antiporter [Halobacteriovorax sp. DA5]